ncbi:MAG: acyl-CoA dehydratase activase-related protein [Terriglobia bacterium]
MRRQLRAATLRAYLRSHAAYRRQHSARSGASGGERTDPGSAEKRMSYSRQRGAVSTDLRIGLIGHPYNIFDPFISMNVIDRLEAKGVTVRTSDTVAAATVNREDLKLPKALFWSYEKEIVGAAFNWLRTGEVDGIIYILSFACGPDSLIQVLVEKEAKRWPGVPIMSVVIDEHTGEAGLVTRLEAFLDMLDRKKCRPALTAN